MTINTPSLSEMGVLNPKQIASYTTVHVAKDMDVLKIDYRREKGSFLPKHRRYEFKRISKPMPGNELKGAEAIRYDISPILSKAISELDALLADNKQTVATKKSLQRELAVLNSEMNERIKHLSKMIDSLE
jgi:hypothetical protein